MSSVIPAGRQASAVDVHVGGRIRIRRRLIGMSQESLAQALGLTFQQVQKYERGSNRVSASKLYATAKVLDVPVHYFFDGLSDSEAGQDPADDGRERSIHDFLQTSAGLELADSFPKLSSALQRRILEFVRVLANEATGASEPATRTASEA